MRYRLFFGSMLLVIGILISSQHTRPWIDYNFFLVWFGFLLITDSIAYYFGKRTIFSNWRNFIMLAFSSGFFWWFYEWANLALKNWAYPSQYLYTYAEAALIGVLAFTTVIPHLIISTNLIATLTKKSLDFVPGSISKTTAYLFMSLGIISLILSIYFPLYFFYLIWLVGFLIIDPINALNGRRSIIVQLSKRNFLPIVVLLIAALLAGLGWETINHIVPKWTYPIVPWFWKLPAPITSKYFEMPLAGFTGYIPFIFSAFAFVEILELKINWLRGKDL